MEDINAEFFVWILDATLTITCVLLLDLHFDRDIRDRNDLIKKFYLIPIQRLLFDFC